MEAVCRNDNSRAEFEVRVEQLVAAVCAKIAEINAWRANESTQAQVRSLICNFLWDDRTGLPDTYVPDEISALTGDVFRYVYLRFPGEAAAQAA